jgi:magnesium transporter
VAPWPDFEHHRRGVRGCGRGDRLVWHSPAFGVVVAASMFTSVNLSGAAGTAIPMLSKRLGFDPAVTAGPVETALQDVFGVTIFLALATALLRWLT